MLGNGLVSEAEARLEHVQPVRKGLELSQATADCVWTCGQRGAPDLRARDGHCTVGDVSPGFNERGGQLLPAQCPYVRNAFALPDSRERPGRVLRRCARV